MEGRVFGLENINNAREVQGAFDALDEWKEVRRFEEKEYYAKYWERRKVYAKRRRKEVK